ncbi:MAG: hypothetical protein QHJ73_11785, partial [Armatimonadota bacterium]|nr:hypothetical protein [Armatimonadota bacterium]
MRPKNDTGAPPRRAAPVRVPPDAVCPNERCVTRKQSHLAPRFLPEPGDSEMLQCAYCDTEVPRPEE